MRESISHEDYGKYLTLCDHMDRMSSLFFMLSEGEPLCHQLILCEDRRKPLSEAEWSKIITANDGKLPKEVAAWEEWDRFPDRTGCSRYFGKGAKSDVADFIHELKRTQALLDQYYELDIPEQLLWKMPNDVRFMLGCSLLTYHSFLEFMSRQSLENDTFPGIITTTSCGLHGLDPTRVKVIEHTDVFASASVAIEAWTPRNTFDIVVPTDVHEDDKPIVKSVTFGLGQDCYNVMSDSGRTMTLRYSVSLMMRPFVLRVKEGTPDETITLRVLHEAIGDPDPASHAASDELRKAISSTNDDLSSLGRSPDGVKWIISRRGMGYFLNPSVEWYVDKRIRKSESVWLYPTDPKALE